MSEEMFEQYKCTLITTNKVYFGQRITSSLKKYYHEIHENCNFDELDFT